jgi:hypothetical protein
MVYRVENITGEVVDQVDKLIASEGEGLSLRYYFA